MAIYFPPREVSGSEPMAAARQVLAGQVRRGLPSAHIKRLYEDSLRDVLPVDLAELVKLLD